MHSKIYVCVKISFFAIAGMYVYNEAPGARPIPLVRRDA